MKRSQLSSFKQQTIPAFAAKYMKGGAGQVFDNFCDWYMNLTGGNPDPSIMAQMMEYDKVWAGQIAIQG